MTEVLHLIDGHGLGHRAYHAAGGRGALQAIGIYASMLDVLERHHRPRRAVVVFDVAAKNWRHDLYAGYKADRPRPELELCRAMPRWKPLAAALGWPVVSARGFEADDVIATLVTRARAAGWHCVVHASDKDLLQLVGDDVHQVNAAGVELKPADVEAKLGVPPNRVADYLALCGDAGDSVPGVAGCGAKTAAELCRRYASIEAVISANPKLRGKYPLSTVEGIDTVRLSRRLVELVRTVELDLDLAQLVLGHRDEVAVRELLAEPRPPEQLPLEAERTGKFAGPAPGPRAPDFGRAPRWTRGYKPPRPPYQAPAPEPMTGEQLERFHERAAIREHLGGVDRVEAERLALADVGHTRSPA